MGIPITGSTIFFLSFFRVRGIEISEVVFAMAAKKRIFCETVVLRLKKNQIRTLGGMVDNKRVRTRSVPFFCLCLGRILSLPGNKTQFYFCVFFLQPFLWVHGKEGEGGPQIRYMSCRLLSPLFPTTDFFFLKRRKREMKVGRRRRRKEKGEYGVWQPASLFR